MYKKADSYSVTSPHYLWSKNLSAIKTELDGLSHWADKVVWVQKPVDVPGNTLAFVSDKDWDGNGKPDNIYIITEKMQSKDDINFIIEAVTAIKHEAEHIERGRKVEETRYEFAPESTAESAEPDPQELANKIMEREYFNTKNIAGDTEMLKSLVKLANHLDNIGEVEISNKLDSVISKIAQDKNFYGPLGSSGIHPRVLEAKKETIIEMAKEAVKKIEDGFYGSVVQKYALTPSIGAQTKLNKYMTPAGQITSLSDAQNFLADFKSSLPVLQKLYDQSGALSFSTYYPERINSLVRNLNRNFNEYKDIASKVTSPQPVKAPQKATPTEKSVEPPSSKESPPIAKKNINKTVLKIEETIGAPLTGSWKALLRSGHLKRFLEDNSGNIVEGLETIKVGPQGEPLERYRDSSKYVSTILNTGIKGFSPKGGSEALNNNYTSWLKFVEELKALDAPITVEASHGHEDYMSKFHAKSIENSAEEIAEDLEQGKELDPWQKSYLAQADLMTDNVEKRLEVMAKQLDKLFKY